MRAARSDTLVIDARKAQDSGIGTYIRNVVPRVLRRVKGVRCTVLLSDSNDAFLSNIGECQLTCVRMTAAPLSLGEQRELRNLVGGMPLFWATSLSHPLFTRSPMLATVHDVVQLALPNKVVGGLAVKLASKVFFASLRTRAQHLLFNSEFSRSEFERYIGQPTGGSTVTSLGVNPEWFSAGVGTRAPQSNRYFICVGNVKPHKNLRTLLSAFCHITSVIPHDLVIVGECHGFRTGDPEFAKSLANSGGRIRFLGRLTDQELHRWVAHADGLIFPSLYEGFGLPALEAMAAGCPVIVSTAGALPEVCGGAASYFDPYSAQSMEDALLHHAFMTDGARQSMVAACVARARQFTWEHTAELTVRVVQDLLCASA